MAKIIWTNEAERWLKDIHDYIAADNPTAAFMVVEGFFLHLLRVERMSLVLILA
ncbi:MAG: type II toxin-antitoxin system RelE/ParE family toxin [Deltaproteobacteria bacterium]|nr:type II toxin-antitoxin system RelE/ParE family toxin [Deltaproteobacteria bacterium]